MRKKRTFIVLISLAFIALIIGIILSFKTKELRNNQIEIIDASYMCSEALEKFYEDDNYTYSFPCIKSSSVYVKFPNGNKMLVIKALEEEKVTIDELIKAGLEVVKKEK